MKKISVGVDLHKMQFTVFFRPVDGEVKYGRFCTRAYGYRRFFEVLHKCGRKGVFVVSAAISQVFSTLPG